MQGIGHLLVSEKLLDKEKAAELNNLARKEKISLVQYLVKNKILSAEQIARTAAQNFGIPMIDLACIEIDCIPSGLVSEELIRRHWMVPLACHGTNLYLATDDPTKHASLKEIQFHTGLNTQSIVVETDKLAQLIEQLLTAQDNQSLDDSNETNDFSRLEISFDKGQEKDQTSSVCEDAPVVQFVNKMLLNAMKQKVSDIHLEPYENNYRIRFRQDGILREVASPPPSLSSRITARIKVMSNLDISERRIPQDGGFKMKITKGRSIDFRVSSGTSSNGEKVVLRLLDPVVATLGIDALGFNLLQKEIVLKAITRPQGMILVTGPTGSGKTVSLYSALTILNTQEVNISTAEDPVEIKVPGINQVNINPKAGLTFASVLRSFLRQDPDVIMIGEIRDLETAEIAINAAQTGHLVLTTLHTNSAAETLNRLINMGIPTFNIASSVSIIIAQRLARRLCTHCKQARNDCTPQSLIHLGFAPEDAYNIKVYKAVGCSQCAGGYRGRVGLYEVLSMTKQLGQKIMNGANSIEILNQALHDGMLTIVQSGLEKIKQGITTIEELNRVTVD